MSTLPIGTVTFLLTDIEGSTRLWEDDRDKMAAAIVRHEAIAAAVIRLHGGTVVKSRCEGDSLFAVFELATEAVAGATALQLALQEDAWPGTTPLHVRAALHTGEAMPREGDYYAPAVNRCARLRALAHGRQTLLSGATYEMVRDDLPPEVSLKDLGTHRLRDLHRPERVFQLLHSALPAEFPSLRSLDTLPTNLPQQLTRFIGREAEMAEVRRLLGSTRLLTLTGIGGLGKTRLSLQVAADVLEEYPDGVWLVELASLTDPALLPHQVASIMGVREERGRQLTQTVVDAVGIRQMLLVLDNCEHMVGACAALADELLRQCPHLRVLATSRQALGVTGETAWNVPALPVPAGVGRIPLEQLTQYASVRLFIDRAQDVRPGFEVTNETAPAVAQVCHRLDGIPLAIELAAARVKALSVERIRERLDDRFRLLTSGSRTALPRQQTLRAAMDWSHDLLDEPERGLLRRVSVFVGGWTLEAAEAVGAGEPAAEGDVLDLLASLVEKSLVVYEEAGGDGRYRLLETVREYAAERLAGSGERDAARDRHLEFCLQLAETIKAQIDGGQQGQGLAHFETERGNLRAALEWATPDPERRERALGIASAVYFCWYLGGNLREGRDFLEALLRHRRELPLSAELGRVLYGAGVVAYGLGDFAEAEAWCAESLPLRRALGDTIGTAAVLNMMGVIARDQGNHAAARRLYEESLDLRRQAGDKGGIAGSLNNLALLLSDDGDQASAAPLFEEGARICREVGDRYGCATALHNLGRSAHYLGDLERAERLLQEALDIRREIGDRRGVVMSTIGIASVAEERGDQAAARGHFAAALKASDELGDRYLRGYALVGLGSVERQEGNREDAARLFRESLELRQALGDRVGTTDSLRRLAQLSALSGNAGRAARLFGAAETQAESIGFALPEGLRQEMGAAVAGLQESLGAEGYAQATRDGRAMALEEAVAYALAEDEGEGGGGVGRTASSYSLPAARVS